MNKQGRVTFEIEGRKITTVIFEKAINHFFDFIEELSEEITKNRKPFLWFVSVSPGSISINLVPEPSKNEYVPKIPELLNSIGDGVEIINLKELRPKNYSDEALKSLRELASMIELDEKGIKNIRIFVNGNKKELSTKAIGNIDAILKTPKEDYGAIEGKLHVISDRRGLHVMVYDSLKERAIRCSFGEAILPNILSAFGKRVSVFGLIKYEEEGKPKNIEIKSIEIFPDQEKLPKAKDVRGILGG